MTTFQDPPPQSRRSARQSERADSVDQGQLDAQTAPPQPFFTQPPAPQPAPESAAQPQTTAQPQSAAQPQTAAQAQTTAQAQSTGRRARPAATANLYEVPPEPLNYSTQGAPAAPPQTSAGYAVAPAAEPPASAPGGQAPFRVRDFSPEGGGRRAAVPLIEPTNPSAAQVSAASDLDYRTQAQPAPGAPAPAADAALSRRELRQRQLDMEALAGAASPSVPTPGLIAPPPAPTPLFQAAPPPSTITTPPAALRTAPPPPAVVTPPEALRTAPPPGYQAAPPPSTLSNAMAEFEALTRNGQLAPPSASERVADPDAVKEPVRQPELAPEIEQTGASWVPPVGHWSRQADLDDETQPWENTITREVGGGNVATTTSALVLPEIPRADPFAHALNSTGEILLTGSIELPRSLGSQGGDSRHYDDSSVDLMFDTQDAEFTGTDSAPVRAIRAVSTHVSARGVIHSNKPHGNRLIIAVFVATAVLAIGVVGMLVASLAFGLF